VWHIYCFIFFSSPLSFPPGLHATFKRFTPTTYSRDFPSLFSPCSCLPPAPVGPFSSATDPRFKVANPSSYFVTLTLPLVMWSLVGRGFEFTRGAMERTRDFLSLFLFLPLQAFIFSFLARTFCFTFPPCRPNKMGSTSVIWSSWSSLSSFPVCSAPYSRPCNIFPIGTTMSPGMISPG